MASHDIRVLSLTADQVLAESIGLTLSHARYVHRSETTEQNARAAITTWRPQLLLIDTDLEAGAALRLIDEARSGMRIGVIALTRRADLHEEIDVFARGADDYVRVPFAREELAARIGAVLSRTHDAVRIPHVLVGDLEIDVLNRRVLTRGEELHLTSLEQAVLYLLASDAGSVFSPHQIVDVLRPGDPVIEGNAVARHVRALRAKLRDDWHRPRYIETVRGAGYRLVPDAGAAPG